MEENKALKASYEVAKSKGYGKSIEEFKTLLETNPDALNAAFSDAKKKGYKKDMVSFKSLVGLKKKEGSESLSPTEDVVSSSVTTQTAQTQPSDSSTDKDTPRGVSLTESQVSMRDPMESLGQPSQSPILDYKDYQVEPPAPASDMPVIEGISSRETDEGYFEKTKTALQQSDEGLSSTAKFLEESPVGKSLEAGRQNLELADIDLMKSKYNLDSYNRNEKGELVPSSEEERVQMQADIDEYNAKRAEVQGYVKDYTEMLKSPETKEYLTTLDEYLVNASERKIKDEEAKKQYVEDSKEAYDSTIPFIPDWLRSTAYTTVGGLMQLPDMVANSPQAMERAIFDLYHQGANVTGGLRPSAYETLTRAGLYEPVFQGRSDSEFGQLGRSFLDLDRLKRTGKKLEKGYSMADIQKSGLAHIADGDVAKGLDLMTYDIGEGIGQLGLILLAPEIGIPLLSSTAAGRTYAEAIEDPNISTAEAVSLGVSSGVGEYLLESTLSMDIDQLKNLRKALSGSGSKEVKSSLFKMFNAASVPKVIQGFTEEALEEGLAEVLSIASEMDEAAKKGEVRKFTQEDAMNVMNSAIVGGLVGAIPAAGSSSKKAYSFLATKWKNSQSIKNLRDERASIDKGLEEVNSALEEAINNDATASEIEALENKKAELEVRSEEIDRSQIETLEGMSEEDVKDFQANAFKANALTRQAKEAKTEEGRKALEKQARDLVEENDKIVEKYDSKKEEGAPSVEQKGETLEQGQPQQETSTEEAEASGVVQESKEDIVSKEKEKESGAKKPQEKNPTVETKTAPASVVSLKKGDDSTTPLKGIQKEIHSLAKKAMKSLGKILPKDFDVVFVNADGKKNYVSTLREVTNDETIAETDKGALIGNTVYINLNNATKETVVHELFHATLKSSLGSEGKVAEAARKMVGSIVKSTKGVAKKELESYITQLEAMVESGTYEQSEVNEEALANLVEFLSKNHAKLDFGVKQKIKEAINNFLESLNIDYRISDDVTQGDKDVVAFLNSFPKSLSKGEEISDGSTKSLNDLIEDGSLEQGGSGVVGTMDIKTKKSSKAPSIKTDKRPFAYLYEQIDFRIFDGLKFLTNMYDRTNAGDFDLGNGIVIHLKGGKSYVPYMMHRRGLSLGDKSNLAAFNSKSNAETFIKNALEEGAGLFIPSSGTPKGSWQFQQAVFESLTEAVLENKIMSKSELIDLFSSTLYKPDGITPFPAFRIFLKNSGKSIKTLSSYKKNPMQLVKDLSTDEGFDFSPKLRKRLNDKIVSSPKFQEAIGVKNLNQFYEKIEDPLNKGAEAFDLMGAIKFDNTTLSIKRTKVGDVDHHPSFAWTVEAKIEGVYQPTEFFKSYDATKSYIKNNLDGRVVSYDSDPDFAAKNVTTQTGSIIKVGTLDAEKVDSKNKVKKSAKGVKSVQKAKKGYIDSLVKGRKKRPSRPNEVVTSLFPNVSKTISDAYGKAKNLPNNPIVKESYEALVTETKSQYEFIVSNGLNVVRHEGKGEPYKSSTDMLNDLRDNNTLKFLPNDEAFGEDASSVKDNIGLEKSGIKLKDGYEMTNSEVFRVVHDYFGHGVLGNQFGKVGEENATLQHLELYSDKAAPAVIFQTRGQNSWVNFSGVNDEANSLRDKARGLRKEGKTEEADALVAEANDKFDFAEPKINVFEDKLNYKRHDTARRINDQKEIDSIPETPKSELDAVLEGSVEKVSTEKGLKKKPIDRVVDLNGKKARAIASYRLDKGSEADIRKAFPNYMGNQKIFEITDGKVYRDMLVDSLKGNPYASSVTVHSEEEFNNMRMFVTEDGSTGVTLTKNGFLGGGFSGKSRPNNLAQLMVLGIKEGALTAEAFDTVLPDYYASFGFKAVSSTKFNDAYKPMKKNGDSVADWDFKNYAKFNNGRPDIVMFIYDGGDRGSIESRLGLFDLYSNYEKNNIKEYDKNGYDDSETHMKQEAVKRLSFEGVKPKKSAELDPQKKTEFARKKKINDFARKIVKDGKESLTFEEEQFYAENMEEVEDAIAEAQKEAPRDASRDRSVAQKVISGQEITDADIEQYEKDPESVDAEIEEAGRKSKAFGAVAKVWKKQMRAKRESKKTTMTDRQGLKMNIKKIEEGAKNAVNAQKDVAKAVRNALKEMRANGKITSKQAITLAKRAASVSFKRKSSLPDFLKYAQNVLEKADYADRLFQARKKQKEIVKRAKSSRFPAVLGGIIGNIKKVNPSDVDIDFLERTLARIEGTMQQINGTEADAEIVRSSANALKMAINTLVERSRKAKLQRLADNAGMSVTQYMEEARKNSIQISKKYIEFKEKFLEGKDPDTPEETILSAFEEELNNEFDKKRGRRAQMEKTVSEMVEGTSIEIAGKTFSLDAIDLHLFSNRELADFEYAVSNFLQNGDKSNIGMLIAKGMGRTEMQKVSGLRILNRVGLQLNRVEGSIYFQFGKKQGVKLISALGLTKYDAAKTESSRNKIAFDESINDVVELAKKNADIDVRTIPNQVRMFVFSFAKQPPKAVLEGKQTMEDFYDYIVEGLKVSLETYSEVDGKEAKQNVEAIKEVLEELKETPVSEYLKDDSKKSKALRDVVEAVEQLHETHADAFLETELAFQNNDLRKVPNYTTISVLPSSSSRDASDNLMENEKNNVEKIFNNISPPRNRTSSKERNDKAYKLKKGSAYDMNWLKTQANSFAASENQIHLMPVAMQQAAAINSAEFNYESETSIFRTPDNKKNDWIKRGQIFIKDEMKQRYTKDQEIRNSYLDTSYVARGINRAISKLKGLSVGAALGGTQQLLRQSPVFLNSSVKLMLTGDLDLLIDSYIDASIELAKAAKTGYVGKDSDVFDTNPLIQKYSVAIRDLEAAVLSSYSPTKGVKILNTVEKMEKKAKQIRDIHLVPLVATDRAVARASFLAFYSQYMRKQGVKDVRSEQFWKEQAENPNEEAVAYALEETQRDHNVSIRETVNSKFRPSKPLNKALMDVFLPFATFGINKKNAMIDDARAIALGLYRFGKYSKGKAKDTELAKLHLDNSLDAAKSYVGHLTEATAYSYVVSYMTNVFGVWTLLGGLFVDDDDKEEFEMMMSEDSDEIYKDKKFLTQFIKSSTPISTSQGEDGLISAMSYLHYYYNRKNGETPSQYDRANKNPFVQFKKYSDREQRLEMTAESMIKNLGYYGVAAGRFYEASVDIFNAQNEGVIITPSGTSKHINKDQAGAVTKASILKIMNSVGLLGVESTRVSKETMKMILAASRDTKLSAWVKAQNEGKEYDELIDIVKEIINENVYTAVDNIKRDLKGGIYEEFVRPAVIDSEVYLFRSIDKMPTNAQRLERIKTEAKKLGRDEDEILAKYVMYKIGKDENPTPFITYYNTYK